MTPHTRLSISVIFVLCWVWFAQPAQKPFSITINTATDNLRVGADLRVEITLTNTSASQIHIAKTNGADDAEIHYTVDVRDDQGNLAPYTTYSRNLKAGTKVLVWSDLTYTLEPGGTLKDTALVTKLYDLTRPGKYSIQVSREIPKNLGGGLAKSNVVSVTIAP